MQGKLKDAVTEVVLELPPTGQPTQAPHIKLPCVIYTYMTDLHVHDGVQRSKNRECPTVVVYSMLTTSLSFCHT